MIPGFPEWKPSLYEAIEFFYINETLEQWKDMKKESLGKMKHEKCRRQRQLGVEAGILGLAGS